MWYYPRVWVLSWDGEFELAQASGNLGHSLAEQSLYFIHFCTRNVLYDKAVIWLI